MSEEVAPAKVVEDVVTDPVEDPPEQEPKEVVDEVQTDADNDGIPDRVQRLEETVSGIVERLSEPPQEQEIEAPGHDAVIKDESPHKRPWHKRGMFA